MAKVAPSKIFDLEEIDTEDDLDAELSRFFSVHRETVKGYSENELHNYLQATASKSTEDYTAIVSALLYGILTEPDNARTHFQCLSSVNRGRFSPVLSKLHTLAYSKKFQKIKLQVKEQMLWLIGELTALGDPEKIVRIYLCLLRQIKGGDVSRSNILFCDQVLKLCITHRATLELNPELTAATAYTYLRLIADHHSPQLASLQDKEVKFVVSLVREKWMSCCLIGRDLIRILHDTATIPDIAKLWDDIIHTPTKLSPKFKGVETLLRTQTHTKFLECRLTPDMQEKLLFMLQHVQIDQYQYNLGWFIKRFLPPESEMFYVDIIRYIVAGWYPGNEILQSSIVPRYVIIGSMIRAIKSEGMVATVRTALLFDWLFFEPKDNIMLIEPAMLLMERSAERYPLITSSTLKFLQYSVEEYLPSLKEYMSQCVTYGMRAILEKKVVRSLIPIYKCQKTSENTRRVMESLFSEFLTLDTANAPVPPIPSFTPLQAPPILDGNSGDPMEKANGALEELQVMRQGDLMAESNAMEEDASRCPPSADDVDRYLYGDAQEEEEEEQENENSVANHNEISNGQDVDMGDNTEPLLEPEITEKEDSAPTDMDESQDMIDSSENDQISTFRGTDLVSNDWEEEDEQTGNLQGLQSNQSFWIFGESMSRFKTACKAAREAYITEKDEEFEAHVGDAKRNLKEILSAFLISSFPAETIAATIAPQIRNIMLASQLNYAHTKLGPDLAEDSIISDKTKDTFDLLMTSFWLARDNEASKEKLLKLIMCLALKGKPHLIGMRWWFFVAGVLQQQPEAYSATVDSDSVRDLFSCYEKIVTYIMNENQIMSDKSNYYNTYLFNDLKLLAGHNIISFHTLVPLIYRYQPLASIGNIHLLGLVATMMLPDQLGKLVWLVQSGHIRIYGNYIDMVSVVSSMEFDAFETMALWQLLAAEMQGDQDKVEAFFNKSELIDLLQSKPSSESLPSLLVILSSVCPSLRLLKPVFQVVQPDQHPYDTTFAFALSVLTSWDNTFEKQLLKGMSDLVSELESEQNETNDTQTALAHSLVLVWTAWWEQRQQTNRKDVIANDGPLLARIAYLGEYYGKAYPNEWSNGQAKNRRKKRMITVDSESDE